MYRIALIQRNDNDTNNSNDKNNNCYNNSFFFTFFIIKFAIFLVFFFYSRSGMKIYACIIYFYIKRRSDIWNI